jgi:hypothetical protein
MSANPYQRKECSLEQLNTLRNKVRQVFFDKRDDILQTPKNKNSPYYSYLKDDIFEKTKRNLSEGTLLKFFHDDINRRYQLIVISTIEEYVKPLISNSMNNNDLFNSDNVDIKLQEGLDEEMKMFAKRIFIELTTRKATISIDEDNDVIEEIYNSWYKLFCIIREEIKILPVHYFKKQGTPIAIIDLSSKILNEVLRSHLTEHQAKFRRWFENAKQNPKYKNITPQELQKRYPDYEILIKSMKQANKKLIVFSEDIYNIFRSKN